MPTGRAPRASFGQVTSDIDLEAVFRREYRRLVGVVAAVTGSVPLAEEAVQEAFARAVDHVRRGRSFEHTAGWIVTVALNEARRGHRRTRTEREALAKVGPGPAEVVHRSSAVEVGLRAAIADLALRQQQAVTLHYLLDLDVATVGRLLGVSTGTVKTALARARDRLHVLLDDKEVGA